MADATVEQWNGVSGLTIADIPLNTAPSTTFTISSLFISRTGASEYGRRVRGIISPSVTGNYNFWIIGDDLAEFYFDAGYGLTKICQASFTYEYLNDYDANPNQKSGLIALTAGQSYEFQVLHKQNQPSGDYFKVVWGCDQPGVTYQSTVPCLALDDSIGKSNIPPWINPGNMGETSRRQWPKAASMAAIDPTRAAPRELYRRYAKAPQIVTLDRLQPNTEYLIRLHGMEGYYNTFGQRVFNFKCNGVALVDVDFLATAEAKFTAAEVEVVVTSSSDGKLVMEFVPVTGIPKISGLEVLNL